MAECDQRAVGAEGKPIDVLLIETADWLWSGQVPELAVSGFLSFDQKEDAIPETLPSVTWSPSAATSEWP